jgi:hypothetical protein
MHQESRHSEKNWVNEPGWMFEKVLSFRDRDWVGTSEAGYGGSDGLWGRASGEGSSSSNMT